MICNKGNGSYMDQAGFLHTKHGKKSIVGTTIYIFKYETSILYGFHIHSMIVLTKLWLWQHWRFDIQTILWIFAQPYNMEVPYLEIYMVVPTILYSP